MQVYTDLYSNVASGLSLGTPVTTGNVVSVKNNAPATYPIGLTNVIWTVTDGGGITATATQTVTVTDNEKPYIERLGVISVANDAAKCGAAVNLFIPYAADNSGIVYVTHNAPSFFPVGTLTIIWTATDQYGNSDTSTQQITVIDNEMPVITVGIAQINVNNDPGKCGAVVNLGIPATSDNCGIASITNDAPALFPVGTTRVTWSVTDLNEYRVTATQWVTVMDNELPAISTSDVVVTNDAGKCGALVTLSKPATSDNCGIASVTNNAPAFFPKGTTVVTWTVKDNSGNTFSQNSNVTVTDIDKPAITAPANVGVTISSGSRAYNVNLGTPTTADNCGVQAVKNNAPSSYPVGTTTVTWTATDNSGNSATAKQLVTVNRKKSGTSSNGQASVTGGVTTGEKTDTEGILKLVVAPNPSATHFTLKLESKYDTPVHLRVTDASGRVVDARSKLVSNSTIQIGHNYVQGIYFAEMIQGNRHTVVQLIKLR